MDKTIFTEDNFYRTLTNMSIAMRGTIEYPCGKAERDNSMWFAIQTKDANNLSRAVREFEEMAFMLECNFSDQFHHTSTIRRICENPNCHTIYAYFYEDFLYCPKCGTKLTETRNDLKEENSNNEKN